MTKSKKQKSRKLTKFSHGIGFVFFIILVCLLLTGIYLLSLDLFYKDRFYPQTFIAGTDVSGQTKNEVRDILYPKATAFNSGLKFVYQEEIKEVKPDNIGIYIDVEQTLEQAFQVGRESFTWWSTADRLSLFYDDISFDLSYKIDEEIFNNFIEKELAYGRASRDLNLSYADGDFALIEGENGEGVNRKYLLALLTENILTSSTKPIIIPTSTIYSRIALDELHQAKLEARQIFSSPFQLHFTDKHWEISPEELADWVDFTVRSDAELEPVDYLDKDNFDLDNFVLVSLGRREWVSSQNDMVLMATLNREKAGERLQAISEEVNLPAQNAKLQMIDDQLTVSQPSEKGREMLIDGNFGILARRVKTDKRELALLTRETGAEVTADNIDELGIKELLATGDSNFAGSPSNRKHNIRVGSDKLNGILVKPGEEYSLIKNIGEVNAEGGYLPELVIKENKTIPEYGGGLCQIATTNFRAAVKAGLDITERKSHSYAVSYYNPQGTDATVYIPHPDLRFINDTPAYILIQTRIDGNKLYFEFYGTSDGREVELVGPTYWDRKEDGSFRAKWVQIVRRDGQEIMKQQFISYYDSPDKYH
ncbi:MAG: VanW family protein [Parcubacteria group bacterium]|nr:VanW family protein [Parcubacteria group bacterium]